MAQSQRMNVTASNLANAEGYVSHSNVNVVEDMVNMISASRSYQANAIELPTDAHIE